MQSGSFLKFIRLFFTMDYSELTNQFGSLWKRHFMATMASPRNDAPTGESTDMNKQPQSGVSRDFQPNARRIPRTIFSTRTVRDRLFSRSRAPPQS